MTDHRQQLEEIARNLQEQSELYKPMFGLMFWQLLDAQKHMSIEEISQQPLTITMDQETDEALGALFSTFIQLWDSSQDFYAASRFMAQKLGMSADELIQTKLIADHQSEASASK